MKRFNLLFALMLLFATVNCFAAVRLPETNGKLFNKTNLENKYLELAVHFHKYKSKEWGTVEIVSDKPFKTVFVKIRKDGSFTVPATKLSFKRSAVVGLGFRYKGKDITLGGVSGHPTNNAPEMVMATYVSDAKPHWGDVSESTQNYMDLFKILYLTDLSAKEESITFKTPNGESFNEYVENIIRNNYPEHLQDPSRYDWMIVSDAHYTVVPGNYYDDSLHVFMPHNNDAAKMVDDYREFGAPYYFGGMVTSRSKNANDSSVTSKVFLDKSHNNLYALYPSHPVDMEDFCFFYVGTPQLIIWDKIIDKKAAAKNPTDYYPRTFKIIAAEDHEDARYWNVRKEGTLKELLAHYEYTLLSPEER